MSDDETTNPYSTPNSPSHRSLDISDDSIAGPVRVMQIIVFALATGVIVFLGVTLFLNQPALNWKVNSTAGIALIVAATAFVASFVVPRVLVSLQKPNADQTTDRQSLLQFKLQQFQTQLIIACALAEGASFFNVINVKESTFCFVAAVIGIALILIRFPTKASVRNWLADKLA